MRKRAPLLSKLDGHGPLVIHDLQELMERDSESWVARTVGTLVEVKTLA